MNLNLLKYLFILAGLWCLGPSSLKGETNSIVDRALESSGVRASLIADYEARGSDFHDERLLAVAVSYLTEKRFVQAESTYKSFLQDSPKNSRGLRGLGLCYWEDGHPDEGIPYFRKAWSLADIDSLAPLGASYLATSNFSEIEHLVPDLLKFKQTSTDIVAVLLAYALKVEPVKAEIISQAIEGLPDKQVLERDDIAQQLATAIERLRSISETDATADKILRKIIRGYLEDKEAWPKVRLCAVGDAYFFLGERAHAHELYSQVLLTQPGNSDAQVGLALTALCESNYPAAIMYCRKAYSSGNQRALSPLAISYLMTHNLEGMADLVPELLKRREEDVQILNSLVAYALMKDPKERELFFKAIKGIPEEQILRRQDTTEAVAFGLRAFGEYSRAEHLLKLRQQQNKGLQG